MGIHLHVGSLRYYKSTGWQKHRCLVYDTTTNLTIHTSSRTSSNLVKIKMVKTKMLPNMHLVKIKLVKTKMIQIMQPRCIW